ncbi:MAG TPA: hypothetical protein VNG32_00435 [Candidatus Dormibacteraeota bacterium]|nr:hypothetical protein [Candidatus Dormibacteraeota bacterium]
MRENKFRVWIPIEGKYKMLYLPDITRWYDWGDTELCATRSDEEWMQYTGLKDKDGTVTDEEVRAEIRRETGRDDLLTRNHYPIVIGNLYENPELLK